MKRVIVGIKESTAMEYTPIHNRFWSDGWVRGLNALDRYLFLYLLTNGRAKLTGIYELPLDLMASESGIDQRDLQVMLTRLEPKIYYREGWVMVINYPKHHIGGGHKFGQGVRARFDEIPAKIRDLAKGYGYPIDTLYKEYLPFPNRREEKRIKAVAPQRASFLPSELKEVREDEEGKEKSPKQKRDMAAWHLRDKLYGLFEDANGVRPTPHSGDYQMVVAALKVLNQDEAVDLVEQALEGKKPPRTVREALSARQIDIYRQDNQ